jgi:putative ABC transport system permease protein
MKLLTYIWRNVTRNKIRASLTVLSIAFSLALMTILYGYLAMQTVALDEAEKHNRLATLNNLGFASPLPIAIVDKISKIEGVVAATPFSWFGGSYKSQQMAFAQFGVEPKVAFDVFDEYKIPAEQVQAFKDDRQGCVADRRLAEQMGWKLGDRIPIEGTIYPVSLNLNLVGLYEAPTNTGMILFNWNSLDDQLRANFEGFAGNAGMIYTKCAVADEVAIISETIDREFANSENSTRTRTEAAFQKMFAEMMGDVQAYIRYISLAVVFALALVAATAMSMSMRERTTEIAVLKAIGFSGLRVLLLVLGESTLIAVLGGILGIAGGLASLQLFSNVPIAAQLFPVPVLSLVGTWMLGLVAVSAFIGFISGLVPAVLAAQLSVVNGLRRVI